MIARYFLILLAIGLACSKPELQKAENKQSIFKDYSDQLFLGVTLYFLDLASENFKPEGRLIAFSHNDTIEILKTTINELLAGSEDTTLLNPFPVDSRLEQLYLTGRKALYLQLNENALYHHPGGATSESQMLEALIRTIQANFPAIREVQLIDEYGELKTTRLDLRYPYSLEDF